MWPLHRPKQEQTQQPRGPDRDSLRRWFDKVDTDHSGHITPTELQSALAEGGLNFSLGTVAAIIRQVDRTGSGTVTFAEFERLHEFLSTVQDSFGQLKADRHTGRVPLDEVSKGLMTFGYDLDPPVEKAVLTRFDPLRSGSMGLQEFLALTLFLRSANSTFKAFDPADSGVVHLNYSQFIYAAVNSN